MMNFVVTHNLTIELQFIFAVHVLNKVFISRFLSSIVTLFRLSFSDVLLHVNNQLPIATISLQ